MELLFFCYRGEDVSDLMKKLNQLKVDTNVWLLITYHKQVLWMWQMCVPRNKWQWQISESGCVKNNWSAVL